MKQDMVHLATDDGLQPSGHPGTDIDADDMRIWAARIAERWRASVQAIIDVGRILIEAKERMPFGTFGEMCETQLPFSARTAQRLMAIASDIRLSNPTIASYLPASWTVLSELAGLTDDEFSSAVRQKIIRPDMVRADVEQIRALTRAPVSPGELTSSLPSGESDPSVMLDRSPGENSSDGAQEAHQSPSQDGDVRETKRPEMDAGAAPGPSEANPMPAGGLAIAHNRVEPGNSLDFFPTPLWATRALIEHVFAYLERKAHCQFQACWEPACGEGHMAEPLKEYFRHVVATDIADYGYGDYQLDFTQAQLANNADWIITNPPFNDSADFVLKALKLAGTGVAMFVRLAWLESVGRYEKIFRDHPPTLISFFAERVPLHKGRWETEGTTMTAYMWLTWIKGAEPRAPFWIPPGCREALTKADDAKRFGRVTETQQPSPGIDGTEEAAA